MGGQESDRAFRMMALSYKVRDARKPRKAFLDEVGLSVGSTVLDFGCGPGSYIVPAARMVGSTGHVYALDMYPLALKMASDRAARAGLTNVSTILSNCHTDLPDGSVDVALLYDVYHDLAEPGAILSELHRVLKPAGILSSHDHHLGSDTLRQSIEFSGPFRMTRAGALTLTFAPRRENI